MKNRALGNIGKRNLNLNKRAIVIAKEIQKIDSKSVRWIASDALRELTSEKIQERLKKKWKKILGNRLLKRNCNCSYDCIPFLL